MSTPVQQRHFTDTILITADNLIRGAANQLQGFAHRVSVNTQSVFYGLRQEVPFERWFYNYGLSQNLSDDGISASEKFCVRVQARAWALASFGESLLRGGFEVVAYAVAKLLGNRSASEHFEVLTAQGTSALLSFYAIISPEDAITQARGEGTEDGPRIGAPMTNWRWGTPYFGTMTIPLTNLECTHYNWVRA